MKKIIAIIILTLLLLTSFYNINVLTFEHFQEEEILLTFKVEEGYEFIVKWIHSVELTPWEEIFRIDSNNNIILDRTRFQQFGAGVPDFAGKTVEIKDGYITYGEINQKIPLLPYGISNFAKHTLVFNDVEYPLYELVPDGDRINIYTENISLLKYLYIKATLR
ncbi:MAG: DUF1850 domain-containing protein [Tissierellales bacterium]|nr:DUF1850 domain-containing protein [Tissierellales bacterium]